MRKLTVLFVCAAAAWGSPTSQPDPLTTAKQELNAATARVEEAKAVTEKASADAKLAAAEDVELRQLDEKRRAIAKQLAAAESRLDREGARKAEREYREVNTAYKARQKQLEDTPAMIAARDSLNAASATAQEAKLKVERLQAEIDKAAAEKAEQERIANRDKNTPEISTSQLENAGEKWVETRVKMTGAKFVRADNIWVSELPGVAIASNGLVSRVNTREMNKWQGFSVQDRDGKLCQFLFCSKEIHGDLVIDMKAGTLIDVYGLVVKLDNAGWYGLVCDDVRIAKSILPTDRGD